VRMFSTERVEDDAIRSCILAAGAAPSGANQQPWHFAMVSSPDVKAMIRREAEVEEQAFYSERASEEWLDALAPIGTDANKAFLEDASHLIAIFQVRHSTDEEGNRVKHYYPLESVGIATGFLIAACHQAGLVTLTHTPSPMRFLNKILGRPSAERPFLLLAVGYPAEGARVPDIHRKPADQILSMH
jgi:iodotyrosine deiodinase